MLSRGIRASSTTPDWAQRILALRKELHENQVEFAERFKVTQTTVSYWERGRKQPSVRNYIRMGNLAEQPACYWFWKQAGVDVDRIRLLLTGQPNKA